MRLKHAPAAVSAVFDDPNLVPGAGLVPLLSTRDSRSWLRLD